MEDFGNLEAPPAETPRLWCQWCYRLLSRPAIGWLLLGGSLLATLLGSFAAWQQLRTRDQARFLTQTERFQDSLAQELERYDLLLHSARSLWAAHPPASGAAWSSYVQELTAFKNFLGLRAFGYIERTQTGQLSALPEPLAQNAPAEHTSVQAARTQDSSGAHFFLKFLEPAQAGGLALGQDFANAPDTSNALQQARDSGRATLISGSPFLRTSAPAEMLVVLPVYSIGSQATNSALRRTTLLGWVCASFQLVQLLNHVHRDFHQVVDVEVLDGAKLLATTRPHARPAGLPNAIAPARRLARATQLSWADRDWTLRWSTGLGFRSASWFSAPGHISAAGLGLALSLLVFGIVRAVANTQKRAQALAEQMTAKLRLQNHAIVCAKHGIFVIDARRADYPVIYANPAFERITGHSFNRSSSAVQTALPWCDVLDPAQLPNMAGLPHPDGTDQALLREFSRNGTRSWAEFRFMPVLGQDGRRTHYLGIVEDVTERMRSTEALRRAEQRCHASNEKLRRAQLQLIQAAKLESIGTLAAGVAHEVKNPLQTILTGVDYLRHTLANPRKGVAIALGDMREAVRRADTIVRELLELSRNTPFELAEANLNQVLERCLRLLSSQLLAARIQVVRLFEPQLPLVPLDPGKMEQVFLNLCLNAIQAMNQGGVLTLTTRLTSFDQEFPLSLTGQQFRPTEQLVIGEVKDNGPGISPENLARVFDPFFTTKPAGQGTGLGLPVVKRIIDLHGGLIDIRNAPERGVVVTIALPVSVPNHENA